MKLLITDYDGTLKRFKKDNILNNIDLNLDLKEINKFIKNDNQFVIATKRTTESIKQEIDKYNINYSYLITYNGAVILDKNNKFLFKDYLNKKIIDYIKDIPNYLIENISLYDEYGKTKYIDNKQYIKLLIKTKNSIKFLKYLKEIKEIDDICFDYNDKNNYFTISNPTNKKIGIDALNNLLLIDKNNIIPVVNSHKDFSMLNEYNRYFLSKKNNKNINVPNIRTLIKTIK